MSVRSLVAVPSHPSRLRSTLRASRAWTSRTHAELPQVELDPVVDHLSVSSKTPLAERGERSRACVVVGWLQYVQKRSNHGLRRGR